MTRIVAVTFNRDGNYGGSSPSNKRYHYLTDIADLAVGDECVVDSPYGGTAVVTVRSLDPVGGIRNATKWIISKIDRARYNLRREATEKLADLHVQLERELQNAAVIERRRQLAAQYPSISTLLSQVEELERQLAALND